MKGCHRCSVALLATLIATAATAQTSIPPSSVVGTPKTSETAKGAAPTTAYRSVFDNFISANEEKTIPWRDANALVGSIGGWRVYAREAQQSAAPNATPPAGGDSSPHKKH